MGKKEQNGKKGIKMIKKRNILFYYQRLNMVGGEGGVLVVQIRNTKLYLV